MDDGEPALRVLGRVQLHGRALRSPATSHVLAWAALHSGRGVDLDRCARTLWPDLPAPAARRRARDAARALAREFPESVRLSGASLHLDLAPDRIDEHAFRSLVLAQGDSGSSTEQRRLAAALGLWRGTPYPGLAHVPLVAQRVARLHELRLDALERRFAMALQDAQGTPDVALVAQLRAAVCTHSDRERLWRLLAGALYLSSRQFEALAELGNCRRRMQQGGKPASSGVDVLQGAVLRGDDTAVLAAV